MGSKSSSDVLATLRFLSQARSFKLEGIEVRWGEESNPPLLSSSPFSCYLLFSPFPSCCSSPSSSLTDSFSMLSLIHQEGLKKMLTLIWSSDKSIVEEVISTFKNLYFHDPDEAEPFSHERVRDSAQEERASKRRRQRSSTPHTISSFSTFLSPPLYFSLSVLFNLINTLKVQPFYSLCLIFSFL